MWAQVVKAGERCEAGVPGYAMPFAAQCAGVHLIDCEGPLEAAHIVPRRFRSVRWDTANGRALCHDHHRYFTDHEKAWRDFIGPEWDRLWVKAQERWDKVFPISELKDALSRLSKEAAA